MKRTQDKGTIGVRRMIFGGGALLLSAGLAFADSPIQAGDTSGPSPCSGSGEVPTPFLSSNQKVELADGEIYTLVGKIRIYRGERAYLEVDLQEHPWLAGKRRKQIPFYRIDASVTYLSHFEGKRVRVLVEAHGAVEVSASGGAGEYSISLQPLAEPELVLQGRSARHPR